MHKEANLTSPEKGQMSMYGYHTLVDLPSQMSCAKIQPQDILSYGEEDF